MRSPAQSPGLESRRRSSRGRRPRTTAVRRARWRGCPAASKASDPSGTSRTVAPPQSSPTTPSRRSRMTAPLPPQPLAYHVHRRPRAPLGSRRWKQALLRWYGENKRPLPWRETRDPYAILVSEVMLQQYGVENVGPLLCSQFPPDQAVRCNPTKGAITMPNEPATRPPTLTSPTLFASAAVFR